GSPQREHPNDVVARVVLIDVALGEDRLLLDEHRVPDPVVHRLLPGGPRLDADHVRRHVRSEVGYGSAAGTGRVHGPAWTAGICRTDCRLLIAEQAWHRAQPAEAMLASIPRLAM